MSFAELNVICHSCWKKFKVKIFTFSPTAWICPECIKFNPGNKKIFIWKNIKL